MFLSGLDVFLLCIFVRVFVSFVNVLVVVCTLYYGFLLTFILAQELTIDYDLAVSVDYSPSFRKEVGFALCGQMRDNFA